MVRRWLKEVRYFGIPLLLLAVTMALVGTGEVLKRPQPGRDVGERLEAVSAAAAGGRWDEARQALQPLEEEWGAMRRRLVFTVATADLEAFDAELSALRGVVEAEDPREFRLIHRRLTTLWKDLTS